MDSVKQPEGHDEHEHQHRDHCTEDEDSGKRVPGMPEEDAPSSDQQNEQFEGEAYEHPVAGHITFQVNFTGLAVERTEMRKRHHEDGTGKSGHR